MSVLLKSPRFLFLSGEVPHPSSSRHPQVILCPLHWTHASGASGASDEVFSRLNLAVNENRPIVPGIWEQKVCVFLAKLVLEKWGLKSHPTFIYLFIYIYTLRAHDHDVGIAAWERPSF